MQGREERSGKNISAFARRPVGREGRVREGGETCQDRAKKTIRCDG
jgi:hypothetical protein